jgi:ribonuclease E
VTLIVNDEPGEECRIAVLANGRLDSYFSERESSATNVGSIYKGRVMNVEAAIQAAFVDFGSGQNGFLHISDLHPRYFPGEGRTEQVGKKIARSERPLIQHALKKGQEILVQVIKEGLGSKGPTLTSYLSLPGRLLVMMPDMDRVGVSRRVDDEQQRREMRRILDSLELPEGFGFILRTAGFDAGRTELLRDAAYLQRLWDAMAARASKTGAPCELYTESDVLVRTLRDHTDSTVEAIVVDSPSAFERAKLFLEVIAPTTAAKVLYYNGKAPIFEAYGVERQIDEIHARSVPLPSGGALVFDQTEALVAVDVNSGRSRSARDSETNAFQTNCEAVEELCRQLRLRDLGGLIVVDCIDMRFSRHRREIEDRLASLLRLDRAKSSFAPISEFGIIEMTRQRMRPSLRKMHYADCPHCTGAGEVRLPDTVAADAMRRVSLLFCHNEIQRVEIVCSVRVAGELMSKRRRQMHELEERFGKRVDVRISEAFAADRIEMYAYDDHNADVELDRLTKVSRPTLSTLHEDLPEEDEAELAPAEVLARRRRRRRRPAPADATAIAMAGGFDNLPQIVAGEQTVRAAMAAAGVNDDSDRETESRDRGGHRGRRDRGGRRGRDRGAESRQKQESKHRTPANAPESPAESAAPARADNQSSRRRRGRRRGRGRGSIDSISEMIADGSAFETAKVATAVGLSQVELLERIASTVDADTAALLSPNTFMLPPELIQRVGELFPDAAPSSEAPDHDAEPSSVADETGESNPSESVSGRSDGSAQANTEDGRTARRSRGRRGRRGRPRRDGNETNSASPSKVASNDAIDRASEAHSTPAPAAPAPAADDHAPVPTAPPATPEAAAKPKRRSLYAAAVRLLSSSERARAKGRPE